MLKFIPIALSILSLSLVPAPASAQMILPGALLLAGFQATCGPVQTVFQPINDIAAAGGGRIYLNPRIRDLPRAQQIFWYTHECAHHIFGPAEAAADCWAVQQGRIQGWLSREDFSALNRSIRFFPGDATHSSGIDRAAMMERCYAD